MVGGGDDGRALLALRSEAAVDRRRGQEWKVEFARYFTAPPRGPSPPPPPPGVRYAFHANHRHPGAWLPAATPASLRVSRPSQASAVPVLTVSIGDVVFEEHFVSILNFSWPQITCMSEFPVTGSRVVFASFCDKYKQVQKFALRFPLFSDAESFLNYVKECLGDTMDIIPSGSDYACEDSSVSEYISSNELQHSFEEPASDHRTEAPAICYHEEPDQPVFQPPHATNIENINSGFLHSSTEMLTNFSTENEKDTEDPYHGGPGLCYLEEPDQPASEPLLATNIDNVNSGFPPSFTEMLANLSTQNKKDMEDPHQLTGAEHTEEVYTQDTCHDVFPSVTVARNKNTANKEIDTENTADKEIDTSESTNDLMARIKTYLADDSFHDMLFKLERVIDELGMDLSL
ncbi:protein POOR HOMOLOGOUS SYNAPSIS 1 isoform X1 [Lolium perenne]|uniref:protein POOR HOMOLOGOUS SYNAPSIS 1 isoform X1 n=1 Tax=Lolium perenne TaxID=4522 RepID=UPI0021F594F0|nr:protein POOR HOMOLOGOUS SYNAPSIS 1-like isoform X1 [Lolium perenne]